MQVKDLADELECYTGLQVQVKVLAHKMECYTGLQVKVLTHKMECYTGSRSNPCDSDTVQVLPAVQHKYRETRTCLSYTAALWETLLW
jgi:hypothetical protein